MDGNHLLHYYFFQEFENIENREIIRLQYRHIRDTSNPFELQTEKFTKLFRLNKMAAFDLIEELREFVDERTREDTVPFHLQVFASLQFFGHGSYQTIVGEDMNLGMSQPIISRAIKKVSILISTFLLPRYVKFPSSDEDVRKAKNSFVNANLDFPNAIGTLDCTHVAIFSPPQYKCPSYI
ncbi:hypothetical protein JTB14_013629 [Gonioctena quinquepunctata]|nr:hypothetical protein JTB14_013629 [Gonioctena quinquepunctata]